MTTSTTTVERAEQRFVTKDPSVFPTPDADEELLRHWTQHGHPHSATYANSELCSFPDLLRYNALTVPSRTAFINPTQTGFATVSWLEFDQLTAAAAIHYSAIFRSEIEAAITSDVQPTLALLGAGNTFDYFVTQLGLLKLGARILLLSDKNADVARDHLLNVCKAVGIIVDSRNIQHVTDKCPPQVIAVQLLSISDMRKQLIAVDADFKRFISPEPWNQHSMIIHSSGSTGLPKPIIHTNRSLMLITRMYRLFPDFVVNNWYLGFPCYHIAGICTALCGIPSGLPITFPPLTWPPSPGTILSSWSEIEKLGLPPVDCLHCAPSVIEDLYDYISTCSNSDFSPLVNLKILQPGGAALSSSLLKRLVGLGVNVKTTYGSTEIGPAFRTIPHNKSNSNCYHVRSLYADSDLVQMEPIGEGLFECVVYKGFDLAAELWMDPSSPNPYRTNDLFIEDPPRSGFFVLQGRKDDLLVHINGEKTNALPLQMALEEHNSLIAKSAIFGHRKPCTAAIIQLSEECRDQDPVDLEAKVWDAVQKSCATFPAHSQINRSMIHILPGNESLPVTPKLNVRRNAADEMFRGSIEAMYRRFLEGSADLEGTALSDALSNVEYLKTAVAEACSVPLSRVEDSTSFYDLSLESQKAARLRHKLARKFGNFPLMFIFEYPTIDKLYPRLLALRTGTPSNNHDSHIAYIQDVIQRYNKEIMSWETIESPAASCEDPTEIIYLTGATGALANALIEVFVHDPSVVKVYCAVRGGDPIRRLRKALADRGYPPEVISSEKLVGVNYDMKDSLLGLGQDVYTRLSTEVTTVIHNAWKMDFNQRVEMFEQDCLQGTMNLLRFSYTKRRKLFTFMSSVSTNMGTSAKGHRIEEAPIRNDPTLALKTGYAQSKFIVEIIARHFSKTLLMPVRLCRVGQLCGHSRLGYWNVQEMFPIMISTGLKHLKAMPTFDSETVNWLPADICAKAVNNILSFSSTSGDYTVHNLVNPSPISWDTFLDILQHSTGTEFARLSMAEWTLKLESISKTRSDVPGTKLLGFFEDMVQENQGGVEFDTSRTREISQALNGATSMSEELMRLYIDRWRESGFM